MIEAMLTSYQTKIDTQQKKLTKLSWQQDAYRDVTDKLTTFKNKYFDILNKNTYLMTPTNFNKFSSTITNKTSGTAASGLKVTTTSNSLEGSYKVKVNQLATAAKTSGNAIQNATFSLDMDKAANASTYTTETADDGTVTRNYSFDLDVQVGSVTKTVSFGATAVENADGSIDMDSFTADTLNSLNSSLQIAFGYSGRNAADITDANNTGVFDSNNDNEWYLQADYGDDGKLYFYAGGNATATITEKTGNFGLSTESTKLSIATQSAITGTNSVAVSVGGVTKNVEYEGVSSTYYDSKEESGNEDILAEYNSLKLAAYKKSNALGDSDTVSDDDLDNYTYTTTQAAKDKNAAEISAALNSAFEGDGVAFSIDGSYITATKDGDETAFSMTATSGGTLGLTKGTASNKFTLSSSLESIGIQSNNDDGGYTININGTDISVAKGGTISSLLTAVNNSDAGVKMTYSSLTNSFEVEASDLGNGGNVVIKGNDVTKALGLTNDSGLNVNLTEGQNAIIEINGQQIYHNSNSYSIDGTTFNFDDDIELGETYSVGITKSYDDIKQTIKDFVSDYNQLVSDVYDYIGTSPKRDDDNNTYEPLTDAEKEDMTDDEIEKWEEAAKVGVIYNDSTISSIMSQIRTALYNSVTMDDGSKFGLYSMGIKTSSDTTEHGKLEIDEDTFNEAFDNYSEQIEKLFTDTDTGIMKKVSTILDNAVRTNSTNRGSLIQKAGLASGSSSTDNYIYNQMVQVQKRISTLQDRYDAKEDYWWTVFTNLETAMSDLNSQSSYISSYLGTSY
jgi:flagellar hook-associated protein 2